MIKRTIINTIVIMLIATTGLLADLVFTIDTEDPTIRNNRFDTGMPLMMQPGEPMLPYVAMQILLPQGEVFTEAELAIQRGLSRTVSFIEQAQEPVPMSLADRLDLGFTEPSREVYSRDAFYPYQDYKVLGTARKNGYDILHIAIYPYQYNPVNQVLSWSEQFTLTIRTRYDADTAQQQHLFMIDSRQVREEVSRLVINPELVNSYRKSFVRNDALLPNPGDPHRMIIISREDKEEVFEEFIDWKFSKGISAAFFTTEDIYDVYAGVDEQAKIRAFIIDAYQTYAQTDTPLEYVILGGDDNIIPIRGMFGRVGQYVDYNMPADIYYSNLDGNWDANGNGIWGEPEDNVDWYAEVALGRIPAFTDNQFRRFFNKTYYYVNNDTYSNDIAFMLGENLDRTPTWGGDYKDEIIPYLPAGYRVDTRYERDGTFSSQAVVDIFHSGLGIINHIGHANYNIVFGLNNMRISMLRNSEFGFAYTQGCYPAAFDNATSEEAGCVGQNLTIARGGLFAFIGNTRYGWYRRGTTNGPSQAFDKTFFSGLYNHNIRELGHTMNYSKEALVNFAMNEGVMRWIYYQLVLFGDPSVAVKSPLGTFPYVEPVAVIYDDYEGDNDGVVNPGETIRIYLEIASLDNWANAEETFGKLVIENDYIEVINDSSMFGFIPTNDSADNAHSPFVIKLDENIPYSTYNLQVKLDAEGVGGAHFSRTYNIAMPVTLIQKNWPVVTELPIGANPVVFDVTGDENPDVVLVDIQGNVRFIKGDADSAMIGFQNNENIWRSTAYADMTNNGALDLVITSRYNKIAAYNTLGDTLFTYNEPGQIVLTPVVADFNNDGQNQVAALDIDMWLHLVNNRGEIEPGFPIRLTQTAVADLAAADITGDGNLEIIAGTLDGMLYVVNHFGSYVQGFPLDLGDQIITAPVILHNYDIVVATREKLFLISREGEILMETTTPGRAVMEIIAADFTGSNSLEFAYVTNNGRVNIIDRNGEPLPGFPKNTGGSFLYPPLATDINGNGEINLLCFASNGRILGFNSDGSYIDALPFPLNVSINAPATMADIDNDGDLEIILATSAGVTVVDYKYQHGTLGPWMTYRGNYQRTGFYGEDESLSVENTILPLATRLNGNYPNPFNPETTISFSLHDDSEIKLEVFNLKGQLVSTLADGIHRSGNHKVVWNGSNNEHRTVGSGVYFYRLTAGETVQTKKMILIK